MPGSLRPPSDAPLPYPPVWVCLVGSGRFVEAYRTVRLQESAAGRLVLMPGFSLWVDDEVRYFAGYKAAELEWVIAHEAYLHLRRIEAASEVVVINEGGYVGEGTKACVLHALEKGKKLWWVEDEGVSRMVRQWTGRWPSERQRLPYSRRHDLLVD